MSKKRNTALAAVTAAVLPPAESGTVLVKVSFDPLKLELQKEAAAIELKSLEGCEINTEEDAIEANEYLKARMREADAIEAIRKAAVAPLNAEHDRIQGMCNPVLGIYKQISKTVKAALGSFALAQAEEQRRALAEVARVAQEPTPDALTEALAVVDDTAPTKLEGTSTRAVWKVKRVAQDLLPEAYKMPDHAKIEAFARACSPEKPPIIPGVVFELEAVVTVRR